MASAITMERQRSDAARTSSAKAGFVDCDVHTALRAPADLYQFLPKRWQEHWQTTGFRHRHALLGITQYPRLSPGAGMRVDSWPPNGGPPGSDLGFLREQLLDGLNVETGVMIPTSVGCSNERNLDFGAALASAVNRWQIAFWCEPEPRLRGSVLVALENPDEAVKEIERWAGDRRFVQVWMPPRTLEPLGRRRYRRVLAAAAANGFPVALHLGGTNGHSSTSSGWPSFYHEEHHSYIQSMEAIATSMIVEGVFEDIPDLKMVLVEGGFAWVTPLSWRLDKHWKRLKQEVPHLRRTPSEYLRDHFWYTTQPMEDPEHPEDLERIMDGIGWDRVMFATDYPHWDQDDPRYAIKIPLPQAKREMLFRATARQLYKLD